MNTLRYLSVGIFSPGQITAIVLVSVLLAALIAFNVYIAFMLHKRGMHKLQTHQLQQQRDALLTKLNAMRAGAPIEPSSGTWTPAVLAEESDEEEEDEDEPDEEDSDEESAEIETFDDEEGEAIELEVSETGTVVRYNRSFTARITQADNDLKARYSELKNYLMSYTGARARMSWKRETFFIGKRNIAAFVVRGKTLCLCLATDPKLFDGTKYKVDDLSGQKKKNKMPCMFRIKSDRRMGYAKELVDIVMAGFDAARQADYKAEDFTMPYKSTEVLVNRHLIKVVGNAIPEFDKEDAMAAAKGIRYNRSFEARIIQSDDALKARYSKLKNYLLSHNRVHCADSWKRETFRHGRICVAAFLIRGKTLCLCLAADPKQYAGTKYKVEDLSLRNKKSNTPLLYRVKSDRRMSYALQLIDRVFAEMGIEKIERKDINYAVPFTATETLIRRGLIRVTEAPARKFQQNAAQTDSADAAVNPNEAMPIEEPATVEVEAALVEPTADTEAAATSDDTTVTVESEKDTDGE